MEDFMKPWRPQLLSVLRIMSALLIFQYGVSKILSYPAGVPPFLTNQAIGAWPGWYAGMLELVLGGLLLIGLFSRPAAFILAGEMAFAYFLGHMFGPKPNWHPLLNGGTGAALFCFTFLYLSAAGPGPWSVDKIFRNKD